MKKVIVFLFVFSLLSCSKGDNDEDLKDLELSGGWAALMNDDFFVGVDFGSSSNSNKPEYYTQYDDETCATFEGYFIISSKTSTSMTLTGSVGTEIILTVIDSTTLSISGTADGYVVAGTLKPVSIVKC